MPNLGTIDHETGTAFWSKQHGWLSPDMFDRYWTTKLRNKATFNKNHPGYHIEQEEKHRDSNRSKRRAYYLANRDIVISRSKDWAKKNPTRKMAISSKSYKNRLKTVPPFRLRVAIGNRVRCAFRRARFGKEIGTLGILGCSAKTALNHIESRWLPGMNWDNYGMYGWHIDHAIPLAVATNSFEMRALCHYTNLQPLWAKDNLSKSKRISITEDVKNRIAHLYNLEKIDEKMIQDLREQKQKALIAQQMGQPIQ